MKYLKFSAAIMLCCPMFVSANELQDAIDAATSGDTIVVSAVYDEGVVIDGKDLTLVGDPLVPDAGFMMLGEALLVKGGAMVTLEDLIIQHPELSPDFVTVRVEDSFLTMSNCTLQSIYTTPPPLSPSLSLLNSDLLMSGVTMVGTVEAVGGDHVAILDSEVDGEVHIDQTHTATLLGATIERQLYVTKFGQLEVTDSWVKGGGSLYTGDDARVEGTQWGSSVIQTRHTTFTLNTNATDLKRLELIDSNIITLDADLLDELWIWGTTGKIVAERTDSFWIEKSMPSGIQLSDVTYGRIVDTNSRGRDGERSFLPCFYPSSDSLNGGPGLSLTLSPQVYTDNSTFVGGDGGSYVGCIGGPPLPTIVLRPAADVVITSSTLVNDLGVSTPFDTEDNAWASAPIAHPGYDAAISGFLNADDGMEIVGISPSLGALTGPDQAPVRQGLIRWQYDLRATAPNAPNARLRGNSSGNQVAYTTLLNGREDDLVFDTEAPRPSYLYFSPIEGVTTARPSLDLLHIDDSATSGGFHLSEWKNDWFPSSVSTERVLSLDLTADTTGWEFSSTADYSIPSATTDDRGIVLSGDNQDEALGFWTLETDVALEEGYLYEANFTVRSTATSEERSQVPTFRCRMNESGHRKSSLIQVTSTSEADLVPAGDNATIYTVVLEPSTASGQKLNLSFDLLHFEEGDSGSIELVLEKVEVQKLMAP